MTRSILLSLLINFYTFPVVCQEFAGIDSAGILSDTGKIVTATVPNDTAGVSGIDTVVNYSSSDSIVYSLSDKMMSLYMNAEIKYQKMELQAHRIDMSWETSTMDAFGVPDTSDSTGKKQSGTPVMSDEGEIYNGKQLGYNFKTKRGRIQVADTKIEEGYYHGERLKKVGSDILFVADGRYTTCDKPDPHYYFFSPRMKVTMQDKVVAEPIYLYLADVPIFWFPVAVIPNKGGRRSGIIAPAIAEDPTHGRLLRHLGYYWAVSDYMDLGVRSDIYTKGSWAFSSNYRYNLRYYLSGGLSGEFRRMIVGEESDPGRQRDDSYSAHIFHRQELDPTARFDVNFTFASNNSYRNTINLDQALRQDITSHATFSKNWEGTPNSMSVNVSRRQSLTNGNINEIIPSVNFNHSQSYPFRSGGKKSGNSSELAWYEMIGVGYSAGFSNNRAKTEQRIDSVTVNISGRDTIGTVNDYRFDRNYRLTQGVNISIAPKLGYFTITPSMNYSDERAYTDNDIPGRDGNILVTRSDRLWSRRGTISTGLSASTKMYGIAQPNILGVSALRHTLTPNLSFRYTKQIIGENLPPKQMMMSFNVGNNFEMKVKSSEEGKEDAKIQLMNIGTGISYNFAADSLRFSDVGLNYRTGLANVVDIGGSAVFDLYKLEKIGPNSYNKVDKFLINEEGKLARMKNFSVSLSTTLAGEKKGSGGKPQAADTVARLRGPGGYSGLYGEDEEPDFSIPWRLSMSWDFSESKVPGSKSRSSGLRGNLEFNLTENWKFFTSGGYDLVRDEVVVPQIVITRDLHCWIMSFSWVPLGAYRSYQFEIRLKAPQLADLKVTKSGSASGIY